jgi:hypothetical protein
MQYLYTVVLGFDPTGLVYLFSSNEYTCIAETLAPLNLINNLSSYELHWWCNGLHAVVKFSRSLVRAQSDQTQGLPYINTACSAVGKRFIISYFLFSRFLDIWNTGIYLVMITCM